MILYHPMIWLSSSTIGRLRDQLRERGRRPSVALPAGVAADAAQTMQLLAEYGPLCEAMYLMMSADGRVANAEREVLKGALRNLSDDRLRSANIESMLDDAAKRAAEQGAEARLREVAAALVEDPARAEVAFVLAAAIAFADDTIADEENELLNRLAEDLGIDEERAEQLLDDVEKDLSGASG